MVTILSGNAEAGCSIKIEINSLILHAALLQHTRLTDRIFQQAETYTPHKLASKAGKSKGVTQGDIAESWEDEMDGEEDPPRDEKA